MFTEELQDKVLHAFALQNELFGLEGERGNLKDRILSNENELRKLQALQDVTMKAKTDLANTEARISTKRSTLNDYLRTLKEEHNIELPLGDKVNRQNQL